MRPERSIVKKAIVDASGNLSKAAALLGCSRTTLYTWIYQQGLEREAGIRPDTRHRLDSMERKDTTTTKAAAAPSHLFNRGTADASIVPGMGSMTPTVATTIRIPESMWKRLKIEAIREGLTLSQYCQRLFEAGLAVPGATPRPKKGGSK